MESNTKINIAFLSEIPTPYRNPIFKKLAQLQEVDIEIYFCAGSQPDRQWQLEDQPTNSKVLRGWQFHRKGKNTSTTFFNPEIIGIIRRKRFDLVVVGGWCQPTMLLAMLTCIVFSIPYVTLSESHSLKPRGLLKKLIRPIFPGLFVRKAKAYLVTGNNAARYVQQFGANERNTFIFPNTIDVAKFQKESARLAKKRAHLCNELNLLKSRNFLFVGRLVKVKGVLDLLNAFEKIAESVPDWGLVIVGDGPLRTDVQHRIRSAELKDRVFLIPFVPPSDLVRYYTACDAFVLPSHDEPWGVVVNEAMASGLPVILSQHVGAAGDFVTPDCQECLFRTGNVAELASRLKKVATDETLRKHLAKKASETIANWGYEKNIEAFQNLLRFTFPGRVSFKEGVKAKENLQVHS